MLLHDASRQAVASRTLAILPRVLILVACVPLFLPPGVCLCAVGEAAVASLAETTGDGTPDHESHDCCSHQHGPFLPSQQPTPHRQHDDHHPACPAADTVGLTRWTDQAGNAAFALPLAAAHEFVFLRLPTEHRRPHFPAPTRAAAHPLYLSHCSLVI